MRDASDYRTTATKMQISWPHPDERLAELAPVLFAQVPLDPDAVTGGDAVHVTGNHGRWVVECPDCHGAQLAHHADPRFLCTDCGNAGNGGKYRPVVWPKNHREISAVLDLRSGVATRHWLPGESVAELKAENEFMPQRPTLLEPKPWHDPKWEGHTHRFPKRLTGDEVSCLDCKHPFPRHTIEAHRAEESA